MIVQVVSRQERALVQEFSVAFVLRRPALRRRPALIPRFWRHLCVERLVIRRGKHTALGNWLRHNQRSFLFLLFRSADHLQARRCSTQVKCKALCTRIDKCHISSNAHHHSRALCRPVVDTHGHYVYFFVFLHEHDNHISLLSTRQDLTHLLMGPSRSEPQCIPSFRATKLRATKA
jgi:hypothetical protein